MNPRCFLIVAFLACWLRINSQHNINYIRQITVADSIFEHKPDSAVTLLKTLINKLYSEKKDYELAQAFKSLGRAYYFKANYPEALLNYQQCDKLLQKNRFDDINLSLRNLYGTFYKKQKQYDKAKEEFEKGLKLAETTGDSSALAGFLGDIGLVHAERNDYKDARPYFQRSLNIYLRIKNELGASYAYDYLAEAYAVEGDFDNAISFMKSALSIRERLNNESLVAVNLNNIGEIYIQKGDFETAVTYLTKSSQLSEKLKYNDLLQHTLGLLSECYKELNNYKLALEFNERKNKLKDSIFNVHNASLIHEAEGKYQSQKKQNEIDMLNAKNELNELEVSKQRSIIVSFGIIILIVVVALAVIFRYYGRLRKSNRIIQQQQIETEHQKKIIEEKQHEILDSINYAQRIQKTILAQKSLLDKNLPEHFVLFHPKDIVSGDFYWATESSGFGAQSSETLNTKLQTPDSKLFYLAVCDSTGHGVPGAFMSLLNIAYLSEAINEKNITEPNHILNYTRNRLINSVSMDGQKDGFDGVLLKIENTNNGNKLTYSAAYNPPVLISRKQVISLPCDKMPVGIGEKEDSFSLHSIEYNPGDTLYLFTDGYADQFGGPKGKKLKYRPLTEILAEISEEPMHIQSKILKQRFEEWRGSLEQIDDVCVVGIRL